MVTVAAGFESALIANPQAAHMFEVFAHPFTAGETVCQSRLGVLRVNGRPAAAEVVDILGNGDYLLRITIQEAAHAVGQEAQSSAAADRPGAGDVAAVG